MKLAKCSAGTYLMREGEEGNLFFIVNKGEMTLCVKGKSKKKVKVGASLGELALLYN